MTDNNKTTDSKQNNNDTLKEQDLIKSNKSAAQQVLDLQQEVKDLKIQLQNREARIMGIQDLLNQILNNSENESNRLHKEVSKNASLLADMSNIINNTIKEQMKTMDEQIKNGAAQAMLSSKFRSQEKLPPLNIED